MSATSKVAPAQTPASSDSATAAATAAATASSDGEEASAAAASSPPIDKSLSMIERGEVEVDEDDLRKLVPVLLEDAASGNLESVTQILNLDDKTPNFSIDQQLDDEGRSALHRAALEGRFDVLKLLLERNPDTVIDGNRFIDLPDRYGNTALFLVCIRLDRSDAVQAKYLLDQDADINIVKKSDKMSVLHWACHHGNPDLVKMLLEHLKANFAAGASATQHKLPFLCDKDARMPIDVAGLQYAQKWIEEDDDLRGDSLLEDAQSRSSVTEFAQVIGMLAMPAWVEVMQPSKSYWNRALFWCATTGDKVGVDAALKSGADAKWRHPLVNRRTALHMAAQYANSADIMRTLIDAMQSVKGGVDVSKILDGDNNNPVHLFVLGTTNHSNNGETGAYPEMLTMLLDAGTPEQRLKIESGRNRSGLRALDYIPGMEKDTATVRALRSKASPYYRDMLENEPAIAFEWVLVFPKGAAIAGLDTQYNKVCKQLRKHNLLADVMPSAIKPDKEVLVMVGCTHRNLRYAAEEVEYEAQLLSSREYRRYEVEDDHLFSPFRSQERMEIIMEKMQKKVFDVDAYLEAGVILRTFPLHDPAERAVLQSLWMPKLGCCCKKGRLLAPFSFCADLQNEGERLSFEHLTSLKMYVGEKNAFYFAWFSHYIIYLVGAAVPGMAVLFVQIGQCVGDQRGIAQGDCLKTPLLPFFCIWMAVWTTIQHEMWKRKQSELAYRWDVLDAADDEDIRPEFRGDECINTASGKIEKYYPESARRKKKYFSPWVVLTFVTAAIIAFIGARLYKELTKGGAYGDPMVQGLVATTINSAAVVVLDQIYKRVAAWITDWENYRVESEYETALVSKTFWFMLVNNTAPLFWAAFYDRDLFSLFKATAITLVSKNMTNVVKDVTMPLAKYKKNLRKMKKSMEDPDGKLDALLFGDVEDAAKHLNPDNLPHIDKTDVRQARMEVLENYVMDGHGGVVGEYAELVIQFAFTTLFACAFPGAPMIVLLINVIGIRGEMFVMMTATQRPETKTAPGIVQAWSNILEIMGFMAILVNLAILVVTFDMDLGHNMLVTQNLTKGPQEVLTSNNITVNATWIEPTETNMSRDWWWYLTGHIRINQLWAMVALEHVLIILKMCLGACIEDTPSWVTDARKREKWEDERLQQIAEEKLDMLKKKENRLFGADLSDLATSGVLTSVADFIPAPPPQRPVGVGFLPEAKEEVPKGGAPREPEKVGE